MKKIIIFKDNNSKEIFNCVESYILNISDESLIFTINYRNLSVDANMPLANVSCFMVFCGDSQEVLEYLYSKNL